MADLVAIAALGLQYSVIVFALGLWLRITFPFSAVTITFLVLAGLGMLIWRRRNFSQTTKQWGTLAVRSVVLGCALFGGDLLISLLHGQVNPLHFPGGLLGLPLTFLICPGGTIISLSGLVRASYMNRQEPNAK